jgi:hypothetical protein
VNVVKEVDHDVMTIREVRVFVRENIWADGASSYSVIREGDEDLLQDEDFDHLPTDREIEEHPDFRYWRLTAGHARHIVPILGCTACEAISPGEWRERYSDYMNATEE